MDRDASLPVFKSEMMGGDNLDLLKTLSAEAVTLPSNDPPSLRVTKSRLTLVEDCHESLPLSISKYWFLN